jgi:hypothetical protein
MEPAALAETLPEAADLARVLALLGLSRDPMYLLKDHSPARGRAELLAHIATRATELLELAEAGAEMAVDDRADLHWEADHQAAGTLPLDLQLARLAWAHQVIARGRGGRPGLVGDTVSTTLGTLIQLIEAWRNGRTSHPDPVLADALLMARDAADHLAGVLRSTPRS